MKTQIEEWRQAVDEYGATIDYEVSSLGRVRSQKPGREGRIMSGGEGPNGTKAKARIVWLMDSFHDVAQPKRVDKLVARVFLDKPQDGERLIHKNGLAWDDRAENLEYRTNLGGAAAIPLPLRGTLTVEQAQGKVKAARKAVEEALETLGVAWTELATAKALEGAQTGVQSFGEN